MLAAAAVAAVVLCGALTAGLATLKQDQRDAARRTFTLRFPKDTSSAQVTAFMRSMGGKGAPLIGHASIAFEVFAASPGRLTHRVSLPTNDADRLLSALRAAMPGLLLEEEPAPDVEWTGSVELRLSSQQPLRSEPAAAVVSSLLAGLLPLEDGEMVGLQVLAVPKAIVPGRSSSSKSEGVRSSLSVTDEVLDPAVSRTKVNEPLAYVVVRLGVRAASRQRTHHLLRRTQAAVAVLRAPGVSFLARPLPSQLVTNGLRRRTTPWRLTSLVNAAELAALSGWYVEGVTAPGVALLPSKRLAAPDGVPASGRLLGEALLEPGRTVAQLPEDMTRHSWWVGATGVGKSTALANSIVSELHARDRRALILIEPKGDLVADVLARVPDHRRKDVLVFDVADPDFTLGLSPLAPTPGSDRELRVERTYSAIHAANHGSWGPRLGDTLYAALILLSSDSGLSLSELPLVFTDPALRAKLVNGLSEDDWAILPVWLWYDNLTAAEQMAVSAPILNKLRPWIARTRLRHLLGVPKAKWSFDEVLRDGRILLISLGVGPLGRDAASLLGLLLMQMLWGAITALGNIPAASRRLTSVYLDEWQTYAHLGDLGEALAMARGYNVGFSLANQSVQQIPGDLREIALSQTRTKVVFNVAHADATILARELGEPVRPDDLTGLGRYEAFTKLLVRNQVVAPFSLRTLPLPEATTDGEALRRESLARYGFRRDEVEHSLRARNQPDEPSGPLGRRRRS